MVAGSSLFFCFSCEPFDDWLRRERPRGRGDVQRLHTYVGPLALALYSVWARQNSAFAGFADPDSFIGLDRMLGVALKHPTRFTDTHLNPDRHALWIADSPFSSLRQPERLG
jgi:hypothetical protein